MTPQPILASSAPAAGTCAAERPCWRPGCGGRVDYVDADVAPTPDGLTFIRLKPGATGKARVLVRGKGSTLALPTLPLTPPVTVQLHTEHGECWTAAYPVPLVNGGVKFRARVP